MRPWSEPIRSDAWPRHFAMRADTKGQRCRSVTSACVRMHRTAESWQAAHLCHFRVCADAPYPSRRGTAQGPSLPRVCGSTASITNQKNLVDVTSACVRMHRTRWRSLPRGERHFRVRADAPVAFGSVEAGLRPLPRARGCTGYVFVMDAESHVTSACGGCTHVSGTLHEKLGSFRASERPHGNYSDAPRPPQCALRCAARPAAGWERASWLAALSIAGLSMGTIVCSTCYVASKRSRRSSRRSRPSGSRKGNRQSRRHGEVQARTRRPASRRTPFVVTVRRDEPGEFRFWRAYNEFGLPMFIAEETFEAVRARVRRPWPHAVVKKS